MRHLHQQPFLLTCCCGGWISKNKQNHFKPPDLISMDNSMSYWHGWVGIRSITPGQHIAIHEKPKYSWVWDPQHSKIQESSQHAACQRSKPTLFGGSGVWEQQERMYVARCTPPSLFCLPADCRGLNSHTPVYGSTVTGSPVDLDFNSTTGSPAVTVTDVSFHLYVMTLGVTTFSGLSPVGGSRALKQISADSTRAYLGKSMNSGTSSQLTFREWLSS